MQRSCRVTRQTGTRIGIDRCRHIGAIVIEVNPEKAFPPADYYTPEKAAQPLSKLLKKRIYFFQDYKPSKRSDSLVSVAGQP